MPSTFYKGHNVWILKVTGFNRGIGIHVFNQLGDLHRLLKDYQEQLGPQGNCLQMRDCLRIL